MITEDRARPYVPPRAPSSPKDGVCTLFACQHLDLMQKIAFSLPQRVDFRIVLSTELLQTIDFPLDGRLFALATQPLDGTCTFRRWSRGTGSRGDAGDELDLHRV